MKKLFVSLPMRGLNEREIRQRMRYLKALVENELKEEVILIDTFIKDANSERYKEYISGTISSSSNDIFILSSF